MGELLYKIGINEFIVNKHDKICSRVVSLKSRKLFSTHKYEAIRFNGVPKYSYYRIPFFARPCRQRYVNQDSCDKLSRRHNNAGTACR